MMKEKFSFFYGNTSDKLQKMVDNFVSDDFKVGDKVDVEGRYLYRNRSQNADAINTVEVVEVKKDSLVVLNGYNDNDTWEVSKEHCKRNSFRVGTDPFAEEDWHRKIEKMNMPLEGIVNMLFERETTSFEGPDGKTHEIHELNWNPYVKDSEGNLLFYQRDFVWNLEQKQLLIESVYNYLNCGLILVRERSFEYVEKEVEKGNYNVGFFDIVDGKQRLNALYEFLTNQFKDLHGNYFGDLSKNAKMKFADSTCFTFGKMKCRSTDEDVINSFLNVNFTGTPMSREHIEYVRNLKNKIEK